jgi:hypothetical protein
MNRRPRPGTIRLMAYCVPVYIRFFFLGPVMLTM